MRSEHDLSLRELYRTLESPGENPLRKNETLDAAVRKTYGMAPTDGKPLAFTFATQQRSGKLREAKGEPDSSAPACLRLSKIRKILSPPIASPCPPKEIELVENTTG